MNRTLDAVVLRFAGYALLFMAAAYLLYLVRGALPIFCVAGVLAYAMEPILKKLERRGHSRQSAVAYMFVVFLLIFVLLIALLASAWQQVQNLVEKAPVYQEQFVKAVGIGRERLDAMPLPHNVKQAILQGVSDFQKDLPNLIPTKAKDAVTWTLSSVGLVVLFLVVLPIVTFWMMLEMNPLRARALILVPAQYRRDVIKISSDINELLGRYVRGQMIVCSLYGVLCTLAFYALNYFYGMQYPLILGGLAALIYIVPYLGMATIATSAGLTAYFTASSPLHCAVIAIGCCLLFNLVIDYGVTPRVVGKGVGLHPLMVIFALLSGYQLGGVLGTILAVPLFASLRVIAIHLFPQLSAPIPQTPPETRQPQESSDEAKVEEIVKETARLETVAEKS